MNLREIIEKVLLEEEDSLSGKLPYSINVYGKEGENPHLHYKINGIEGCIRLDIPRYYFTNLYLEGKLDLEPIISVGKSVSEQIRNLIVDARMTDEQCQNLETKYEEQIIRHGYMFGVEL